jgi:uncharacterized protein
MTTYFIDTSALVKRYVKEKGSAWVRSAVKPSSGNTIIVATITQVEIMSAVARRQREGSISARIAKTLRLLMDRHFKHEYEVISMTSSIVTKAKDLLAQHPLRAYDAVQLATAVTAHDTLVANHLTAPTFVCSDTRLLDVAEALGLAGLNPVLNS